MCISDALACTGTAESTSPHGGYIALQSTACEWALKDRLKQALVVQQMAFQNSMDMNMSTPLVGKPDRDFAVEMISHHQVTPAAQSRRCECEAML